MECVCTPFRHVSSKVEQTPRIGLLQTHFFRGRTCVAGMPPKCVEVPVVVAEPPSTLGSGPRRVLPLCFRRQSIPSWTSFEATFCEPVQVVHERHGVDTVDGVHGPQSSGPSLNELRRLAPHDVLPLHLCHWTKAKRERLPYGADYLWLLVWSSAPWCGTSSEPPGRELNKFQSNDRPKHLHAHPRCAKFSKAPIQP